MSEYSYDRMQFDAMFMKCIFRHPTYLLFREYTSDRIQRCQHTHIISYEVSDYTYNRMWKTHMIAYKNAWSDTLDTFCLGLRDFLLAGNDV